MWQLSSLCMSVCGNMLLQASCKLLRTQAINHPSLPPSLPCYTFLLSPFCCLSVSHVATYMFKQCVQLTPVELRIPILHTLPNAVNCTPGEHNHNHSLRSLLQDTHVACPWMCAWTNDLWHKVVCNHIAFPCKETMHTIHVPPSFDQGTSRHMHLYWTCTYSFHMLMKHGTHHVPTHVHVFVACMCVVLYVCILWLVPEWLGLYYHP